MAITKCSTPGCDASLGNLCDEILVLFNMKAELIGDDPEDAELRAFNPDVKQIEAKLEKELKLSNHLELFKEFFKLKAKGSRHAMSALTATKTLIVTCYKGHKNQYLIQCK